MPLTDEDIAQIVRLIQPAAAAVLTLAEAIRYTKHESHSAFYRWCKRWGVRSITNGRFSRPQLDRAIDRESRKARFRSPEKRKAA